MLELITEYEEHTDEKPEYEPDWDLIEKDKADRRAEQRKDFYDRMEAHCEKVEKKVQNQDVMGGDQKYRYESSLFSTKYSCCKWM